MKCPRCSAPITTVADASGLLVCVACGARLRARRPEASSASNDLAEVQEPWSTLLEQMRLLHQGQQEILTLLRPSSRESGDDGSDDFGVFEPSKNAAAPVVRTGRRKSVLIIDDDASTRATAVAAFQQADVPVRTAVDGNASLAAIAEEKPDVIVLELAMGGAMAGKDVINMIKATMDWVDIPIILHTRMPIESQKEARTVHGADDLIPKAPDSANVLVARVVALFRR